VLLGGQHLKKGGQVGVTLLYSRLQVGYNVMDGVKFESSDNIILSLYTLNDSERSQPVIY